MCSGLCINKDKTEVIPLNIQNVDKHKLGISWQKGSFKMLGISKSTALQAQYLPRRGTHCAN